MRRATLFACLLFACLLLAYAAPAAAEARSLTLDGPGATRPGHQVTFTGRVTPAEQGLEIGIYLGSSRIGSARTSATGFFVVRRDLHVSGDYQARTPGGVSPPHAVAIRRPLVRSGSKGRSVRRVARTLAGLDYAVHDSSATRFDGALRQSVYAFQKAQGLVADGVVGPKTRAALRDPRTLQPRWASPRDHLEVDLQRQLLLVVRGGDVGRIVNASTGKRGDRTPKGRFRVFRRVSGLDTSPLGKLFNPLYFHRGYAIHGSTSVPPNAASHGCVRVALWEAERLFREVAPGEVVYVY